MKKTVNITLGGIVFQIEEGAYDKLREYLEEIRLYFSSGQNADLDIMDDIESSIAEKFAKNQSTPNRVISMEEVDELIRVMGCVEDFYEDDELSQKNDTDKEDDDKGVEFAKRLYRNPDDVVFAGVCSGIAEYFGVDPVYVRLFFIATCFFGGAGVFVYLLLWLIIPEASTHTQKLEMKGKPVTIRKIERSVKEAVGKIEPQVRKSSSKIKRVINFVFTIMARIFDFAKKMICGALPLIGVFFGAVLALVSLIFILITVVTSVVMIRNIDSPYFNADIPINEIVSTFPYSYGVASAAVIILIPLIMLLLAGFVLVTKRKVFSLPLVLVLLLTWMSSIAVFGVVAIGAAPKVQQKIADINERETLVSVIDVEEFDKINVSLPYKVNITQGEEYSVELHGRTSDLERISIISEEGVLKMTRNQKEKDFCLFCYDWPVTINITVPELTQIESDYSAELVLSGFESDSLILKVDGNTKADIDSNYEKVFVFLDNYSRVYFSRAVEYIEADLDGGSRVYINNFTPKHVRCNLNSYSRLYVENKLAHQTSSTRVGVDCDVTQYSRISIQGVALTEGELDVGQNSGVYLMYPNFEMSTSSTALKIRLRDYSDLLGRALNFNEIDLDIDDNSVADLSGNVVNMYADLYHNGRLNAYEMIADNVEVNADDYSRAKISVNKALKGYVSGNATVYYSGNPKVEGDTELNSKLIKVNQSTP